MLVRLPGTTNSCIVVSHQGLRWSGQCVRGSGGRANRIEKQDRDAISLARVASDDIVAASVIRVIKIFISREVRRAE